MNAWVMPSLFRPPRKQRVQAARVTISEVSLFAAVIVLGVAIIDWRRGRTGLLHMRLDAETTPDRFWAAIVLYINMALGLFWMAGQSHEPEPACDPTQGPCELIVIEEPA